MPSPCLHLVCYANHFTSQLTEILSVCDTALVVVVVVVIPLYNNLIDLILDTGFFKVIFMM